VIDAESVREKTTITGSKILLRQNISIGLYKILGRLLTIGAI
jgi:hypothetical protein